jgi:SAM-dependent methyltransferase
MKTRDSGMPDEAVWESFFEPDKALRELGLTPDCRQVVDLGCGYGTFSLAAARITSGRVLGLDIDPVMIDRCRERAAIGNLDRARFERRDFVVEGTGLDDGSADFVMLFNILHAEEREALLTEAHRVLAPAGRLAVTHWNPDPATPRGPAMDIRPHPEDCRRWMRKARFEVESAVIDLPPWHFGLTAVPA